MISYERQERIAVNLIGTFLSVWCDRGSDSEPHFNCGKCEFQTDDGKCLAKMFINEHRKSKIDMPQGVIAEPCVGGDKE